MKAKPVEFLSVARLEVVEAYLWYAERELDVGERFLAAVRLSEIRIQQNPEWGAPYRRKTRKMRVEGFPYHIVYREETDKIVIYTVAHGKRKPDYWINRL